MLRNHTGKMVACAFHSCWRLFAFDQIQLDAYRAAVWKRFEATFKLRPVIPIFERNEMTECPRKPRLPTSIRITIYIYIYIYIRLIALVGRVRANGPGDLVSIPGRVIPKTFKVVLDTSLLNTQRYTVRIKGKVEQSSVVAIEKGDFWSPST